MEKGLQDGKLLKGKLRINARRRSTAFVTADGGVLPSDIFLDNEKARNRAQEGDVVRQKTRMFRLEKKKHMPPWLGLLSCVAGVWLQIMVLYVYVAAF